MSYFWAVRIILQINELFVRRKDLSFDPNLFTHYQVKNLFSKTNYIWLALFNFVDTRYIFQRYTIFVSTLCWRHHIFCWFFLSQFVHDNIICAIASIYFYVSAIIIYYLKPFHIFSFYVSIISHKIS